MKKQNYKVLGLMSGTSLDGIDCAVVDFTYVNNRWNYELIFSKTVEYSQEWTDRLKNALFLDAEELQLLNLEYTRFLGAFIQNFINVNNLSSLDLVASHGHTVLPQPENKQTLQIGNLPLIADFLTVPFIGDFRVQDVQLGGQGAPLVPIGDRLLFDDFDYCLNLGGFSNISFEQNGNRIAFDICPVNTLLNHFAQKEGMTFDKGGRLAKQGKVNDLLLKALNNLDFYRKPTPKSLGMEQVNAIYLPLIHSFNLSNHSVLATLTEHIAYQITQVVQSENSRMLITGGGAFNSYLIERMGSYMSETHLELGFKDLINFKEAIIFAFLGVLRMEGINNVLSTVTGASHDHCSGMVYW